MNLIIRSAALSIASAVHGDPSAWGCVAIKPGKGDPVLRPHLTEALRRLFLGFDAAGLSSGGDQITAEAARMSAHTMRSGHPKSMTAEHNRALERESRPAIALRSGAEAI